MGKWAMATVKTTSTEQTRSYHLRMSTLRTPYASVMPAGSADDEEVWLDDEGIAMQLNAYAAVASELEEDTLGEEYAEAAQQA